MNTSVMHLSQHQAVARAARRFSLGAQSTTLRTGRRPGVLVVHQGCAWVTLPGQSGDEARDLWLQAGQSLPLAPNQTLWVDGWPQAELQLLPAPRAAGRPSMAQRLLAWALRRRLARQQAAAAASCCGA